MPIEPPLQGAPEAKWRKALEHLLTSTTLHNNAFFHNVIVLDLRLLC